MGPPLAGDDPDAASPRPSALRVTEASEVRERRCADCGTKTAEWKPVRRKGVGVILCPECAAKVGPSESRTLPCGTCGAPLAAADVFCGKCGTKVP